MQANTAMGVMLWRIDETACNYPHSRCKFGLTQMKGNQFSLGTPRGVVWLWLVRTPPSKHAGSKKMRLHIDATKPLLCCMWGNVLKQALYKRNSEWYRTSLVYIFSWQWEERSTMRVIGPNKRVVSLAQTPALPNLWSKTRGRWNPRLVFGFDSVQPGVQPVCSHALPGVSCGWGRGSPTPNTALNSVLPVPQSRAGFTQERREIMWRNLGSLQDFSSLFLS